MIKGLTYVIAGAEDVPAARRFYTEKLGLATEDDVADIFSQFTTRAGTLWGIAQRRPELSDGGIELYLEVEDADEAHRTWRSRGVEMVDEPHDMPFGRTFAFRDHQGRVLHAYARPGH